MSLRQQIRQAQGRPRFLKAGFAGRGVLADTRMKGGFTKPSRMKSGLRPAGQSKPRPGPTGQPVPPSIPFAPAWNARYETDIGAANRRFADTSTALAAREQGVRAQYGFDPQYANDPYTRASMLRTSWLQNRRAASTSMAARGQLYSGSLTNALGYADEDYARGSDEAQRDYASQLGEITQDRTDAARGLADATAEAEARRIEAALADMKDLDTSGITLPDRVVRARKKKRRRR